jgi:MFS family permease
MVASLIAVRLFDEWFSFLPAGSLEPLRIDLDLTYEQLSVLLVLMTVGGLAGGVCAVAADRVSRRAQSMLGALGYALSMACWGLGDRFWILAAGSFLLGVSSDALLSACEVALVDLAGDDDLVAVLAPSAVAAEVGDLLGPLLLVLTAAVGWGYRAPFLVGAVVLAVYAVVLAVQPLPPPMAREEPTTARADVWACLRDRQVWQLGLISLLSDTLDEPLLGFAIAYLEVDRGQPHGVAVLVGGSVVLGGIIGAAAMAARVRRGSGDSRHARLSAGAALGLAVSVLGIMAAPLIPLQALFGLTTGMASAIFWTRLQARILGLRPGQAGTTAAVVGYLAMPGALVPLGAAAAADHLGLGAALAVYVGVAILLTAVTVVSGRSFAGLAALSGGEDRRPLSAQRPAAATCSSVIPPSAMR